MPHETHISIQNRSAAVCVGGFECAATSARWNTENKIIDAHQIVFPWTAVAITQEGKNPVVADPSNIMFYNKGQRYNRTRIASCGDRCVFIALDDNSMQQILGEFDPASKDRPAPFDFTNAPSSPALYYEHHRLFRTARSIAQSQPLELYERAVSLVRAAVAQHYSRRKQTRTTPSHCDAVHAARTFITANFTQRLTIDDVAAHVDLSPYHLCRIYKNCIGQTIHQHLNQTRLCAALEPLADSKLPLASLAVQLGFSDQAHFTNLFKRAFSIAPAAARRQLADCSFPNSSKNLQDTPILLN